MDFQKRIAGAGGDAGKSEFKHPVCSLEFLQKSDPNDSETINSLSVQRL
jgi:hypothetical protein